MSLSIENIAHTHRHTETHTTDPDNALWTANIRARSCCCYFRKGERDWHSRVLQTRFAVQLVFLRMLIQNKEKKKKSAAGAMCKRPYASAA